MLKRLMARLGRLVLGPAARAGDLVADRDQDLVLTARERPGAGHAGPDRASLGLGQGTAFARVKGGARPRLVVIDGGRSPGARTAAPDGKVVDDPRPGPRSRGSGGDRKRRQQNY